MRTILILITSAILFIGCSTVPSKQRINTLFVTESPALLPDCGVPVGKLYEKYRPSFRSAERERVFSKNIQRPVVWVEPLRTKSLSRVLAHEDCLRICRPSDSFWHWIDFESAVIFEGKIKLLANEYEVVEHLNTYGALFSPQSRDDAELVLLAFAELCGYQIITKAPAIPHSIPNRDKKRQEAEKVDWSFSWKSLPEGWEVSCVLVTKHENKSSSRYTIVVLKDGGLKIREVKTVFFTQYIL